MGKTIAEKIDALLEDGSIPSADKLKAKIPAGLVEITRMPGLGPKRARLLHDQLGVASLDELREAAEAGPPEGRAGLRPEGARRTCWRRWRRAPTDARSRALLLSKALAVGEEIVDGLREHPAALRVELAGSARRMAETVQGPRHRGRLRATRRRWSRPSRRCEAVDEVHTSGEAGAKGVTHSGLPVDLRIVPEEASATCSSTSPARGGTTRRCAPRPSSAACT